MTLPRVSLAAGSGVLLALSFPKFGHWSVAWLALVPLLLSFRGASPRQACALGYTAGVVSSLGLLYWTSITVIQYGGLSWPVAVVVMVLLCLAVALFPALFGWLVGRWLSAFGLTALLFSPLAWVATELLRAHTFYHFPWCLLGYSQQPNPRLIQIAAFTAVYGVSFVVAASSASVAYAIAEARTVQRAAALAGLFLVLAATLGYGAWALSRPVHEAGRARVGLVQASILQDDKWDPAKAWENVEGHLSLTRSAAAQGARLVVWPESAAPFLYDEEPYLSRELQELVREKRIYLLFGNDDREIAPPGRVWVGAKMLTPEGQLPYRYHKINLVPFGEYVPLKPLITLGGRYGAKLVRHVADFTPGTDYSLGSLDGHRLGTLICYEAIFPALTRRFASRGAELLVNITTDAWYGRTSATYQHFAMAAFRAVENGTYLVRAANTGITAVVDPKGRVVAQTQLFERTVLVRDVPFVPSRTFYARHGDLFAWSCFAATVALTLATFRKRQR